MFTGIIEGFGTIRAIRSANQGKRLAIESDYRLDESKVGDSISVSGVCLTMVKLDGKRFDVDISPETLQKTTFGSANVGQQVNLERALRLSDRIDGHLVSGHIDGMGTLTQSENLGNAIIVTIDVPDYLSRYMINKGSVAVDGISLTINACTSTSFSVSIIPYTAAVTTLGQKKNGARVNIETDMIGKYVERFTSGGRQRVEENPLAPSGIAEEFLRKTGFID